MKDIHRYIYIYIYIYIYNIYIYISEYSGLFIAFHDIISLGIYDCDM